MTLREKLPASSLQQCKHALPFVDGDFIESPSGPKIQMYSPVDGCETLDYRAADSAEIDAAVAAAASAFDKVWAELSPSSRKRHLTAFADAILAFESEFAELDSVDMGKPISAARGEVAIAAGFIRYYAEAIDKIVMGEVPLTGTGATEIQHWRPRGVVAAIIPWNFPLINACLKLGPALAAGNTCILKPSDISPRSAVLLAAVATLAGIPDGVVSVLPGDGNTARQLVADPAVSMLTFTGSTATGRQILAEMGKSTIKPVLLECGGKSAEIVFESTRELGIEAVASRIVAGAFWNQGQVCVARSRILIQASCFDELSAAIVAEAAKIKPGLPSSEDVQFGPLASRQQLERVLGYIDRGVKEGGKLLLDGRSPANCESGFFVGPTVIAGLESDSPVVREEIFGPVIVLLPFDDEEHALTLANDSEYGLAATLWTTSQSQGHRMAARVRAGKVRVMSSLAMVEPAGFNHSAEPCGQSGFGVEGGLEGMRSYLRKQSVEHIYG